MAQRMVERRYYRHPTDIPIEYTIEDVAADERNYLKDISHGGLSFMSRVALAAGTVIEIRIPFVKPMVDLMGRVVWCRPLDGLFMVGAEFIRGEDTFRARMVEQVCHIESYKKKILETEGRELTGEQAALEWISRYAAEFAREEEEESDGLRSQS